MIAPKHLAIIMDGNGRWAVNRSLPRSFGHIKGTRVAKKIITTCADQGIESLILYAFSTENWLRPQEEVTLLMRILDRYLKKETQNLIHKNIRFSCIGDLNRLPADILNSIEKATLQTNHCSGLHLIFALSYGSRFEITKACQHIAEKVKTGEVDIDSITPDLVSQFMMTPSQLEPDLIIRTSGEKRISNFLLWQSAYSELYFTDCLWPDFTSQHLQQAFADYAKRNRRFGKVNTINETNLSNPVL